MVMLLDVEIIIKMVHGNIRGTDWGYGYGQRRGHHYSKNYEHPYNNTNALYKWNNYNANQRKGKRNSRMAKAPMWFLLQMWFPHVLFKSV